MRRRVIVYLALILGMHIVSMAPLAQEPPLLDLTLEQSKSDEQILAQNGGEFPSIDRAMTISSSNTPFVRLPIEIRGIVFDKSEYQIGGAFTYTIALTNTGPSPVDFPWSPELNTMDKRNPDRALGRTVATIWVRLVVDDQEDYVSVGTAYGSQAHPGTVRTIPAGATVRIRGLGRWQPIEGKIDLEHLQSAKPWRIRVGISFEDWPVTKPYADITMTKASRLPTLVRAPTPP